MCVCVSVCPSVRLSVMYLDRNRHVLCELYILDAYIFGQRGPWRVTWKGLQISRGGLRGASPPPPKKVLDCNRLYLCNIDVSETYMDGKSVLFQVT